ncbi:MAG: hypothetical protein RLY31_2030 [Bacteroidota bacterium]
MPLFSMHIVIWVWMLGFPVVVGAAADPGYDHCTRAYHLTDVSDWCSTPGAFSNEGATASGRSPATCFPYQSSSDDHDVWFRFTAVATTLNISVTGQIENRSGGTLQYPQLAVYQGDCSGELQELACISDVRGYHIVETFIDELVIGQRYYVRVDGRNGRQGTFQLCIRNFNPTPAPTSDCGQAVILCDKSSINVPSVLTAGRDRQELPEGLCLPTETQSVWYKWTCAEAGTLTFSLKPVNPSDDLDFALFLLPDGLDDCANKIPLRCMASGENVGEPFLSWLRCSGETGLRDGERDLGEEGGCEFTDNNFLAPLRMEAGMSYALMVNNYHNTGNGFSLSFGGTGTIAGPSNHFTFHKLSIPQDQDLFIKDASAAAGGIRSWQWSFGTGAHPQQSDGKGPFSIRYDSPGKKSIALTIETNSGCQVTKVRSVTIQPLPQLPPPSDPPSPEPAPVDRTAPLAEPDSLPAVPVVPQRTKDSVTYLVKFDAVIYFDADSFELDSDDEPVLQQVLDLLRQEESYLAVIEGHTNNIPSDEYCRKLATLRADAAYAWLSARGIPPERMLLKVFGKEKVVTRNIARKSRVRNQRVEIKIITRAE